jgi:hypothetical protein
LMGLLLVDNLGEMLVAK